MMNIDSYAYSSKLNNIDALEKLFFTLLTIFICLWLNSIAVSLIILFVMTWVTVRKGCTPFAFFLKLMSVPMSFLLISVVTIAFNVAATRESFVLSVPLFHSYIGISKAGLMTAFSLFFKVLASVASLYFLSLSTPMVELLSALRRLKCPSLFSELMALIYRFIFVLMETAQTIYTAQNARLGYTNAATSFRSLGALISVLFVRAYKRSDTLYTALECRGYEDNLHVLEEPRKRNHRNYLVALGFNGVLIVTALLFRS